MGVLEEILAKMEQLDSKVQRLLNQQEQKPQADAVLNIDEACIHTGYSKSSIYHHARQRTIPHYRHEGKLMFKTSELDMWMLGKRVLTQEEINNKAARYVAAHKNN